MKLKIVDNSLLDEYKKQIPSNLDELISGVSSKQTSVTKDSFDFYISVASVYSSKIEGEEMELDSYLKHKYQGIKYLPDYTKRIDDLAEAYKYAMTNPLNRNNIIIAHTIITKHILITDKRGKLRTAQMFIADNKGQVNYVAADAGVLHREMDKWFDDLAMLTDQVLDNDEALFYASMLHLTFVNIHPFDDGNGRTGRLLEKWFLSNYFGKNAWQIESERYYYENLKEYYYSLNRLGNDYEQLDYSQSLPFTQLLLKSLAL